MTVLEAAQAAMDREIARIFAGERRIGKVSELVAACIIEGLLVADPATE